MSVVRKELRHIVVRAHVVNDTRESVRCAPGTKRDSSALLQAERTIVCEPHAEIGFVFSIPRFRRNSAHAFVRVSGTTFACGFDAPIEDDALRVAALSLGAAALLVAVVAGVVLYERSRARPSRTHDRPEPVPDEEVLVEPPAPLAHPPAVVETTRGIEARGFAAVLDEQRVVMGALECREQRWLSSDFVAKVVNQTEEPVLCSISGRTRGGVTAIAPGTFRIHPQSAAAVTIAAPLRLPWRLRTLHLNMESASLRASAQADVPVPLAVRIASATLATVCAVAIAWFAYATTSPSIAGFAVPARVLAGSPTTASYALWGVGSGSYDVVFDGNRIAGGTIPAGNGSFTFPTSLHAGTYVVTLRMHGPLGSASRVLQVNAMTRLAPLVASIGALAVEPGVAAAGAPVSIRYSADAESGTVSLAGAAGIVLESAPYSASGTTTLRAPAVDTPTQYEVSLYAARGTSTAHTSVGLLVLPKALATPPSIPSGLLTASALLRLPSHVVSARGFTLDVLAHPSNLSLTLQNERGGVVATETVPAGASSVRLVAPHVRSDERFYVVARFSTGSADQVLLDPLTIYAR
jgi:hypothetical protein